MAEFTLRDPAKEKRPIFTLGPKKTFTLTPSETKPLHDDEAGLNQMLADAAAIEVQDPKAYGEMTTHLGTDPKAAIKGMLESRWAGEALRPNLTRALAGLQNYGALPYSVAVATAGEMEADPKKDLHSLAADVGRGFLKTMKDPLYGKVESMTPLIEKRLGYSNRWTQAAGFLGDAVGGLIGSTPGLLRQAGKAMEATGRFAEAGEALQKAFPGKSLERFREPIPMTEAETGALKGFGELPAPGETPKPKVLRAPEAPPVTTVTGRLGPHEAIPGIAEAEYRQALERLRVFFKVDEEAPRAGTGATLPEAPVEASKGLAARTRAWVDSTVERVHEAKVAAQDHLLPAHANEFMERMTGETAAADHAAFAHVMDMHERAGLEQILKARGYNGNPGDLARYLSYESEGLPKGWDRAHFDRVVRTAFPGLDDGQWSQLVQASAEPKAQALMEEHDQLMRSLFERDQAGGLEYTQREGYLPHAWKDPEGKVEVVRMKMGKKLAATPGYVKGRSIPTLAEGLEAGLTPVDNIFELDFRRAIQSNHGTALEAAIKGLSGEDRPLIKSIEDAPGHWVQYKDGKLAGKAVQPGLDSYLRDLTWNEKDPDLLGRWYDLTTGRLKGLNFFFDTPHAWNMAQNVIIGGGNPLRAVRWFSEISNQGPRYTEAMKSGAFGGGRLGMGGSRELMQDLLLEVSHDHAVKGAWDRVTGAAHAAMWEYLDKAFKLEMYDKALGAGLSPRSAGRFAAHFVGDYGKLPAPMKQLSRFVFTLRWQYINLSLHLNEMIRAPQKYAAVLNLYDAVNTALTGQPRETAGAGRFTLPVKVGERHVLSLGIPSPSLGPVRMAEDPIKYIVNVLNPLMKFSVTAAEDSNALTGQNMSVELRDALEDGSWLQKLEPAFWKASDIKEVRDVYRLAGGASAFAVAVARLGGLSPGVQDPIAQALGTARQLKAGRGRLRSAAVYEAGKHERAPSPEAIGRSVEDLRVQEEALRRLLVHRIGVVQGVQ